MVELLFFKNIFEARFCPFYKYATDFMQQSECQTPPDGHNGDQESINFSHITERRKQEGEEKMQLDTRSPFH